jgi:proteasome lid subunit RPN8/RPN11
MTSTSTYSDQGETASEPSAAAETLPTSATRPQEALEKPAPAEVPAREAQSPERRAPVLHGAKPAAGQIRVAMTQLSLRQIEGHATRDLGRELGGVLLGEKGQDEEGYFVKVLASLPVRTSDHGPVHFTFTADSWSQLHAERSQRYPDMDIVGWYHTHPNLGVFYSADDVVVHKAAFVMPWQVGLVYDPVRGEGCLIGWQRQDSLASEPELAEIDGYYEILDEQIGSVATWQFLRSTVWREGAYPDPAKPRTNQIYAPSNAGPILPPISPWWGVMLGGLSLLITLLLLIDRILASAG